MEEILNDLIMLNDTELSRIEALRTDTEDDDPMWDIIETLRKVQSQHVYWLKGLKHGISEGYI